MYKKDRRRKAVIGLRHVGRSLPPLNDLASIFTSPETVSQLRAAVRTNQLFRAIRDPKLLEEAVNRFAPRRFDEGQIVTSSRSSEPCLFVVESGMFVEQPPSAPGGRLHIAGDCFGELSVLLGTPWLVRCEQGGTLHMLDAATIKVLQMSSCAADDSEDGTITSFLQTISSFEGVSDDLCGEIARSASLTTAEADDPILSCDEPARHLYYVVSGQLTVDTLGGDTLGDTLGGTLGGDDLSSLESFAHTANALYINAGEFVGTESLWPGRGGTDLPTDLPRYRCSSVALIRVTAIRITPSELSAAGLSALQSALRREHEKYILAISPVLSCLTINERVLLAQRLEERPFTDGATVVTQGETGSELLLLSHGRASIAMDQRRARPEPLSGGGDLCQCLVRCLEPTRGSTGATQRRANSVRRGSFYPSSSAPPAAGKRDGKRERLPSIMRSNAPAKEASGLSAKEWSHPRTGSGGLQPTGASGAPVGPVEAPTKPNGAQAKTGVQYEYSLQEMGAGDCVGEGALRSRAPYEATITTLTSASFLVVSAQVFEEVIGSLEAAFMRGKTRKLATRYMLDTKALLAPSDMQIIRAIGAGSFATVWMVHNSKSRQSYALKVVPKSALGADRGPDTDGGGSAAAGGDAMAQARAEESSYEFDRMTVEKDLLKSCDHHLLPRLFASWQSDTHLLLMLELVQGGELFSLLDTEGGRLPEVAARFYCACVASALCYMHARGIAYRDVKPENILIDSAGYAKLVDLGFAKVIPDRSFTLCGTPGYIAPELVDGTGHNMGVDWWTLGVLCYEILLGFMPFYAETELEMFAKIQSGRYAPMPFWWLPWDGRRQFISELLTVDCKQRLGCRRGAPTGKHGRDEWHQVCMHPFLSPIDFALLERRMIAPPHVPRISSATDASCFEDFADEEEEGRNEGLFTPEGFLREGCVIW